MNHDHDGIPPDRIAIDDAGNVTYQIAGHLVPREDFMAFMLLRIEMNLRTLADGAIPVTAEKWTDPAPQDEEKH